MGGAAETAVEMTTSTINAPVKERKFQLVRVEGAFSRGRWRCVDFPDSRPPPELMETLSKFDADAKVIAANFKPMPENESSTIIVTSIVPQPPTPQRINTEEGKDVHQPTLHENPPLAEIKEMDTPRIDASPLPTIPVKTPDVEDEQSIGTVNVVAIDSKIEQAMDLVKTHLTFAVREEVEVLRHTINELEQKVATLESQNNFLRQYIPQDVINNLPTLISQYRTAQAALPQNQQPSQPRTSSVVIPAEFKNGQFESTLNNVVAEVRNAVSGGNFSLGQPPKKFSNQQEPPQN
ncbi:unnamed protein product, partial [Mesorhabditis belari]|uniref:Uncharacterized protein n=1 Tax=Mesorhabditis belari TaxID=2138241 RepID=A0AAF3F304_9BILA